MLGSKGLRNLGKGLAFPRGVGVPLAQGNREVSHARVFDRFPREGNLPRDHEPRLECPCLGAEQVPHLGLGNDARSERIANETWHNP